MEETSIHHVLVACKRKKKHRGKKPTKNSTIRLGRHWVNMQTWLGGGRCESHCHPPRSPCRYMFQCHPTTFGRCAGSRQDPDANAGTCSRQSQCRSSPTHVWKHVRDNVTMLPTKKQTHAYANFNTLVTANLFALYEFIRQTQKVLATTKSATKLAAKCLDQKNLSLCHNLSSAHFAPRYLTHPHIWTPPITCAHACRHANIRSSRD